MDHHVAYIAGIIDGEGSIVLSKRRKTAVFRTPIVSVSSTTLGILEYLQSHYGGSISKHKVYQEHHKQSWSWKLDHSRAVKLCEDVLPYLLEPEKRRRAKLLVDVYGRVTMRNGKYTPEQLEAKKAFEHEFFHLSTA